MDNEDLVKFIGKKVKVTFKNPDFDDDKNYPGEEIVGTIRNVTESTFKLGKNVYQIDRIQSISRSL